MQNNVNNQSEEIQMRVRNYILKPVIVFTIKVSRQCDLVETISMYTYVDEEPSAWEYYMKTKRKKMDKPETPSKPSLRKNLWFQRSSEMSRHILMRQTSEFDPTESKEQYNGVLYYKYIVRILQICIGYLHNILSGYIVGILHTYPSYDHNIQSPYMVWGYAGDIAIQHVQITSKKGK
jgi:hypothetical protein